MDSQTPPLTPEFWMEPVPGVSWSPALWKVLGCPAAPFILKSPLHPLYPHRPLTPPSPPTPPTHTTRTTHKWPRRREEACEGPGGGQEIPVCKHKECGPEGGVGSPLALASSPRAKGWVGPEQGPLAWGREKGSRRTQHTHHRNMSSPWVLFIF